MHFSALMSMQMIVTCKIFNGYADAMASGGDFGKPWVDIRFKFSTVSWAPTPRI
jgi:hypothetical protein